MSLRVVETKPCERIVVMNETHLLKFIGWVEAHRTSGDREQPRFLYWCLEALEMATGGAALDATITCGGCGLERDIPMFFDGDAGGWFCHNEDECNQRRMEAAS
jgi:hypothetical protein